MSAINPAGADWSQFESGSCVGRIDISRMSEFESMVSIRQHQKVCFPTELKEIMQICHGGVPLFGSFLDDEGTEHVLCRYFNFLRKKDLGGQVQQSWRSAASDIRLDYSIWRYASGDLDERLGRFLVPFAGVDTHGHNCRLMADFDALCFDFAESDPRVVVWIRDDSWDYQPKVIPVAPNFKAFLPMLHRGTHPCLAEVVDSL